MACAKRERAARARIVRYSDFFELSRGRAALFMPLYARSLHGLVHESHVGAPLPAAFLLRAAADVLRGLVLLHAAGVAHCDVKASNICVDYRGAAPFVLVDLGSVARFGEAACSTEAYVPSDYDASGVAVSSPQLDWWMLAAALAEKAKDGLGFGATRRHERAAIVECVQRRLPDVWKELGARLEDGRCGHYLTRSV